MLLIALGDAIGVGDRRHSRGEDNGTHETSHDATPPIDTKLMRGTITTLGELRSVADMPQPGSEPAADLVTSSRPDDQHRDFVRLG